MKNITISVDEAAAARIRVAAAKAGQSMSKYLAEAGIRRVEEDESGLRRSRQREALDRLLAGPKWDVTIDGRMPTSEERNARK